MNPLHPRHIAEPLADLAAAGLPLASGLRALGEEAPSPRVREALLRISARLERGETLDHALRAESDVVPDHLRGIIEAGVRSGDLGTVLARYLDLARSSDEMRRNLWVSLAYPAVVLTISTLLIGVLMVVLVPQFRTIFDDFGVELPGLTRSVIGISSFVASFGAGLVIAAALLVLGVWLGLHWLGVRRVWRRSLAYIPLIGGAARSFAVARFCHVLALLVQGRVLLPEAVRMAGEAADDERLRRGAERLAVDVERGGALSESAASIGAFPRVLLPVFRWHDRGPAFTEALAASGEMFAARSQAQLGLLALFCEPIVIVIAAIGVGTIVIGLFLPLMKLLNELS